MTNEVEKFDPSKLMEGVRDRIRATFVSLIPDEQWGQMVKKEVDAFFETKEQYTKEKTSAFREVVWKELEKQAKDTIANQIGSLSQYAYDINGQPVANKMVEQIVIENADKIFARIMVNMVQQAVNSMPRY